MQIIMLAPGGHVVTEVHGYATFSTGPAVCVSTDNGTIRQTSWYPTRFLRVVMLP